MKDETPLFPSKRYLADAVRAGAQLLDKHWPDWAARIDTSILALDTADKCILGQLYGGYHRGLNFLDLNFGSRHGFCCVWSDDDYLVLDSLWLAEIEKRLAPPQPSGLKIFIHKILGTEIKQDA